MTTQFMSSSTIWPFSGSTSVNSCRQGKNQKNNQLFLFKMFILLTQVMVLCIITERLYTKAVHASCSSCFILIFIQMYIFNAA
jgi:hypothetical protein